MCRRRHLAVPDAQARLDERRHAGDGVGVAEVPLDRAHHQLGRPTATTATATTTAAAAAAIAALFAPLVERGERANLNRVADARAGAVRLDVVDVPRLAPGVGERHRDHLALPRLRRLRERRLARAVVVEADALEGGVGAPHGAAEVRRRQHNERGAVGGHRAGRRVAKRPADAVGGPDHPGHGADRLVGRGRGAAAQRNVAEAEPDRVGAARHRDERRRARGRDRLGGAVEVEVVGERRREEVLVVRHLRAKVRVGLLAPQLVQPVEVRERTAAHEDADAPRRPQRLPLLVPPPRVLEGVVRQLEEESQLAAHVLRTVDGEAPPRQLEPLVGHHALAPHVRSATATAATGTSTSASAGAAPLWCGEGGEAVGVGRLQEPPQPLQRRRPRQPHRHARHRQRLPRHRWPRRRRKRSRRHRRRRRSRSRHLSSCRRRRRRRHTADVGSEAGGGGVGEEGGDAHAERGAEAQRRDRRASRLEEVVGGGDAPAELRLHCRQHARLLRRVVAVAVAGAGPGAVAIAGSRGGGGGSGGGRRG